MSAGWAVHLLVELPLAEWEALVVAARSRRLSPGEFAALAVQRELRLPQAASWEEGVKAASLAAEPWQLSVLSGEALWPPGPDAR
jgi:hypothetical protein